MPRTEPWQGQSRHCGIPVNDAGEMGAARGMRVNRPIPVTLRACRSPERSTRRSIRSDLSG